MSIQENTTGLQELLEAVNTLPDYTAKIEEKDVNFYDYDGTLLRSYTMADIMAMTELPELPKQPGLICQSWNWSLASIKAYGKPVDVGAIYSTEDGSTRLFLEIVSAAAKGVTLCFKQTVSAGITIDWGDGQTETVAGTDSVSAGHEYASVGRYVIKLTVTAGVLTLGWNDGTNGILGDDSNANRPIKAALDKVYIGSGVLLGSYAFQNCANLHAVVLPEGCVTTAASLFATCRSLRHVNLPISATASANQIFASCEALGKVSTGENFSGLTANTFINCHALKRTCAAPKALTLGYGAYYLCYSIRRAVIDSNVTTLGGNVFLDNQSVLELTVPASVTTISASAMSGMRGLARLKFEGATPPTVANANAFTGIPSTCVVEVPADSLEAYKNATNYGNIAAQMMGGKYEYQNRNSNHQ